jgi:predicted amidophosphoribosyltransferase
MRTTDAIRLAGALLAPPRCAACADPCAAEHSLCRRCWSGIASAPAGRTSLGAAGAVTWAAPYEGAARQALTALKFGHRTAIAAPLGAATAAACADLGRGRTVVAVPSARRRLRARGFDPAALIAAGVAARLRLPTSTCMHRTDHRRQVGRARADRLAVPPTVVAGTHPPEAVLLVDDVLTTGATIAACARALRAAGCESVAAACFARSL